MSRREKFKKGLSGLKGDIKRVFGGKGASRPNTPSSEQSHTNASVVDEQATNPKAGAIATSATASTLAITLVNPQPSEVLDMNSRVDESIPQIHSHEEDRSGVRVQGAEAQSFSTQPKDTNVESPADRDPSNSQDVEPIGQNHTTDSTKNNEANSTRDSAPQASHAASAMRRGLKELTRVLGPITDLFGPIKEIVAVIEGCVDTYEMAGAAKLEYEAMRVRLEALIEDLKKYTEEGHSLTMTTSMESICGSIRAELEKVRNKLEKSKTSRSLEAPDETDAIIRSYQRIELDLQRLGLNANWETMKDVKEHIASARIDRLSPSLSARYNSAEADDEFKRQACTPGTRISVLKAIINWADSGGNGSIYWLNGMAGTGKTTIAYSLCDKLQAEHKLAASFFCSRLREECRSVKRIIPSIAYQLAEFSLPFQSVLSVILQKERDVHLKSLQTQFDELVAKPLARTKETLPKGLLIVIDALDECDNKDSTGRILDILLNGASDLPVRFLVSSRPEAEIRDRMTDDLVKSRLVLHELEKGEVQADIESYLRAELAPMNPSEEHIAKLVARAGILFIYAATVVRYIGYDNFRRSPGLRLRAILDTSQAAGRTTKNEEIDQLYATVLGAALGDRGLDECEREEMQQVLYTVICAREPLTVKGLSDILQINDIDRVRAALRPMWSVLHVVRGSELVTTLHASFPDFMFDSARSKVYYCDSNTHHHKLAERCLDFIAQTQPQFNICGLESSYLPDTGVPNIEERVANAISAELLYACRYWVDHVQAARCASRGIEQIKDFLSTRLLLWMETLNLKNQMKAGIECMKQVVEWCKDIRENQELAELALDAKRFVEAFASNPVSQSTPHIYVSMLAFWPRSTPITKHYARYTRSPVLAKGTALGRRQLAHLSTWAFEKPINKIAVSPDGCQIALVFDMDLLIVDPSSGRELLGPLQGHTKRIEAVAFPPDGSRILAGSFGCPDKHATILGWSTRSGDTVINELQLHGHTDNINCLNFSPDCTCLATGSDDNTVRLWDTQTGETLLRLQAQDWVRVAVFSPDGTRVAAGFGKPLQVWDSKSGDIIFGPVTDIGSISIDLIALSPDNSRIICAYTYDKIIQVGDVRNNSLVFRQIAGHRTDVSCIAYSPDGKHIASGSGDQAVRLWDIETGNMILGPLKAHTHTVISVAFSPDGSRITSACEGGLVCTWDAQHHSLAPNPARIPSHYITCVKFSSDGVRFVSGSREGTICIRDADTGAVVLGPVKVHTRPIDAVDFKNDRVVTGSKDGKICVCDARSGEVVLGPFEAGSGAIGAIAYSPDGNLVATGSNAGVDMWNAHNGSRVLGSLTDLPGAISSVRFSPDGTRIVASSWGNSPNVVVWDVSEGRNLFGNLGGHRYHVISISLSPNGALIASGSGDKTIIIWDAYTGKIAIGPLTGHSGQILSVSFSPDSTRLVSSSYDKTIRIWDVQTGKTLFELSHGHQNSITSVEYSPGGTRILSHSDDRSVQIHDARSPKERARFEFGNWTIDRDGWVVDGRSRLLVWVPGDLRNALLLPRAPIIVGKASVWLKFDRSRMGESWAQSYTSDM